MKLGRLYQVDETAWLEESSRLIKERKYRELDFKNLQEFLADMARRDRREVMSRLTTLLVHILKWDYQPRKRSRSWQSTILVQQGALEEDFLESKTLRNHAAAVLPRAYSKAVAQASVETGLPENRFTPQCPYALDELLGPLAR